MNFIEQRLISPRIPFMQIRRLRHVNGQYGIYGQIINVPVEVDTMVKQLPRNIEDDHCFYVHLRKKLIHKTSYVHGLVNKRNLKKWLQYLVSTPLYIYHDIKINDSFMGTLILVRTSELPMDEISEHVPPEDNLTAQQQTLLWNEDEFLCIAPGENKTPVSLLFDEYAEELSFPTIYGGQFRKYKEGTNVTPFMQATSEIRRTDRRATDPQHLLYVAAKIMRLRVSSSISVAFKHVGHNTKITKENIQSEEYINNCIETNLAFLRCIPNSAWYWSDRKKDLFAMIRQLGAPTAFMTLSANETGWTDLLKLLYKLKNNGEDISKEFLAEMSYVHKAQLVNEDAVTCAIYFNKLVNTLMKILESKLRSPFGKYRVLHYFKRIEFQHRGSPHAHILLWLDNVPKDLLSNNDDTIRLIDELVSVSEKEASGNIKLVTHKHTFTCYKKMDPHKKDNCRFGAPFMPTKKTITLIPMKETDSDYSAEAFKGFKKHYHSLRTNLEKFDYKNFDDFYTQNNITSDTHYYNIIRAGINRPRLFYKRTPSEKWYNTFNPFVFHHLKSNMDFQIIQDEYSCAAYVVEYVNKHNRGISNLQRQIIEIMDEHPEFDIVDITKKMSIDVLHSVEMPAQEAAWYLLREPMAKSSIATVYIPTIYPNERQRIRKTMKELNALDDDCTDIWKENWFDKYQKRPEELNEVTLAQFVSKYYLNNKGNYTERKTPRIIRYRNYDVTDNFNDYRREMVLLHIPFRSEENDVIAENKFIQIYEGNRDLILERRKEFESNLDIAKTLEICRQLCRENDEEDEDDDLLRAVNVRTENDPYEMLLRDPHSNVNADLQNASLSKLGSIAEKRANLMDRQQFYEYMRMANDQQKELLMTIIHHLQTPNQEPFQIFFTGPAGTGKTFVIKLIMEIYNRFTDNDGYCNAYITCASTGKAAVAIDGTTVHTALRISISRLLPLSSEIIQLYRSLFRYVKVLIIDEISMISAELLQKIDLRLKQITGNHKADFGNIDVILIGDLRQLPPVRSTPIYKTIRTRLVGPHLWRKLKFYELTTVMRQANIAFSAVLTKIGNGDPLEQHEFELIESRFFKQSVVDTLCPNGVRLFWKNQDVDAYNNSVLQQCENKVISTSNDVITGSKSHEQEANFRIKLHKKTVIDTGGLPYEIIFVVDKYYLITTNIDVCDGLCNGAAGKLVYLEYDESNILIRVWLEFCGSEKIGRQKRRKAARLAAQNGMNNLAVPIDLRTATISLTIDRKVVAKRKHFPLVPALAMTIHKSQGATFNEVVYKYSKQHSQELVYVALSRATNIENLYIVTEDDSTFRFFHNRRQAAATVSLIQEFKRLQLNTLETKAKTILNFIDNKKGVSFMTFNCQSLKSHKDDLTDSVTKKTNVLFLTETWINTEDESINVPNFNCIAKFKRDNVRAGGVGIFQNIDDITNILTTNMAITMANTTDINLRRTNIGDICACMCKMENGVEMVMVVIYISPNSNLKDIELFIHRTLLEYTEAGSQLLGTNFHRLPLILAGDFNVNFADSKSDHLKTFLLEKFNLTMNNNPADSTTKYGTTIDAVFSRYLDKIESQTYVSYFSYHRPIVSMVEILE